MEISQEEENLQRAFEQFMVSGKKGSGAEVKQGSAAHTSPGKKNTGNHHQQQWKKAEKQYWKIINAFQGTLERDWLHVDDQLEQVVSSISNLRGRIKMESQYLEEFAKDETNTLPWKQCGYRCSSASDGGLTRDDVELALSHDLLQHEKMMAGARALLASQSQAQDALGRRLEELMLFHMDTLSMMQQDLDACPSSLLTIMGVVDKLQSLYASLALELYRKQMLIQDVLDAVNDELLARDDDEDGLLRSDGGMEVNPRRVAEKCVREWPRGSKYSQVDATVLNGLLELGG